MSLLEVHALSAFYGDFQALFGVDLHVEAGECVAIIGANGAGKSTLLRAVTGLLPAPRDAIRFDGATIGGLPPNHIVARGVAMAPEGRHLFSSLSIEDNLLMGAYCGRKGPWSLAHVYGLFPMLEERRRTVVTALSGGQQQMVAVGRALMANPALLLCDELSLGLAPLVIRDIYAAFAGIRGQGMTIVVVEQDISRALGVADRVYCLQEGKVTLEGRPRDLTRAQIRLAYFGA